MQGNPTSAEQAQPSPQLRRLAFDVLVSESLAEDTLQELMETLEPSQRSALGVFLDARDRYERALRDLGGALLKSGVTWDAMLQAVYYSFETVRQIADNGVDGNLAAELLNLAPEVLPGSPDLSTALASRVFETTDIAIYVFGPDGTLLGLNPACTRILGVANPALAIGKFNVLTDPLAIATGARDRLHQAFSGQTLHVPRTFVRWSLPENPWLQPRESGVYDQLVLPLRTADGEPDGIVVYLRELEA